LTYIKKKDLIQMRKESDEFDKELNKYLREVSKEKVQFT